MIVWKSVYNRLIQKKTKLQTLLCNDSLFVLFSLAILANCLIVIPASAKISSNPDASQIIQKTLDIKSIQQYFHVKTNPERTYVVLVSDLPYKITNVKKFGHPIPFRSRATARTLDNKNQIVVEALSIKDKTASVKISYPLEGVVLTGQLRKNINGKWAVTHHTAYEH